MKARFSSPPRKNMLLLLLKKWLTFPKESNWNLTLEEIPWESKEVEELRHRVNEVCWFGRGEWRRWSGVVVFVYFFLALTSRSYRNWLYLMVSEVGFCISISMSYLWVGNREGAQNLSRVRMCGLFFNNKAKLSPKYWKSELFLDEAIKIATYHHPPL